MGPAGRSGRCRAAPGGGLAGPPRHAGAVVPVVGLQLAVYAVQYATAPAWWRLVPDGTVSLDLGGLSFFTVDDWAGVWTLSLFGPLCAVVVVLAQTMAWLQAVPGRHQLGPPPDTDLSLRVAELTATRAAALDAHAVELRRIERSLHDGSQNRLVAVTLLVGAARRAMARDPAVAEELLERAQSAAELVLVELREVVRSVLPPRAHRPRARRRAERAGRRQCRAVPRGGRRRRVPGRVGGGHRLLRRCRGPDHRCAPQRRRRGGGLGAPLREGLALLLRAEGLEVVATAASGEELLVAVAEHEPDVAVIDVRMPPTHTDEGIRAAVAARQRQSGLAVLVLSVYVEQAFATELLAGPRALGGGPVDPVRAAIGGGRELLAVVLLPSAARPAGFAGVDDVAHRHRHRHRVPDREARDVRPHGGDRPTSSWPGTKGRPAASPFWAAALIASRACRSLWHTPQ